MANIVLVTSQCYLLCESIHYISVREGLPDDENQKECDMFVTFRKKRKKKLSKLELQARRLKRELQPYTITIDFIPVQSAAAIQQSRRNDDSASVNVVVRGYDRCLDLYRDMLGQIREQQPDKLFLNNLVEKFFTDNPAGDPSL